MRTFKFKHKRWVVTTLISATLIAGLLLIPGLPKPVDAVAFIQGTVSYFDDLLDVNVPAPTDNYIVYWNDTASEWQARAENTSIWSCSNLSTCNVSNLGNVNAISPSDNDFFYWNNTASKWQNRALVATDIPNLDTVKITTGTFIMARLPVDIKTAGIIFIVDGVGSAITTGEKGHLEIPFNCTIIQATITADQSGSIVVDVWKDTYANFPPTDADNITGTTPPTITTAQKSQDNTLTDWTINITTGDILAFNVDSCTNITRVTLSLKVDRT